MSLVAKLSDEGGHGRLTGDGSLLLRDGSLSGRHIAVAGLQHVEVHRPFVGDG
jgi:hypothetical protein